MDRATALKSNPHSPATTPPQPFAVAADGARLHVTAWGEGAPVLFLHNWAMQARMWDYQFAALAPHGLRCLGYDRRGHGRSDQSADGYDYDTLADDVAAVIEAQDLHGVTLVGHSMGAGEIVRYLTRHGGRRVKKIVLLAPTTPFLAQTPDNPSGLPLAAFEAMRTAWTVDFPGWVSQNAPAFFTPATSPALIDWAVRMMLEISLPVALACNRAVTETDFRAELAKIDTPCLVIHGDADVSAPLALTGAPTAALIPNRDLKVYEGAPHGLMFTHTERLNADLLQFIGS
ncbi:MAG: alpha/beta hydrolase [Caulobacteraceae bacterium]|nr:alpha/beta hydrolase [Caulobacteraceae bacterium]